ncbi:Uncharacterized membrane protein HdeD, DUF308 family [Roseovarius azorensis]|uniref:Uncharacterized membrane protein HdeD, DUF308 family n=1 Tax=Roseovarius azorensis TaxID=1287727 RepID=A0A1H7WUJ0_9RHOB|nr:DUF308 domain-containing protein [Roseovarius azorensis]SEM25183.1 Uncharacterized membrane protein HdeD, DUF308 family [Roseovarius azorensis]
MTDVTNKIEGFCSLSKNWWAFVLRGVLAVIIAGLAWFMPVEAVLALALVFGAFTFADGVFGLIAAVRQMREGERWGWLAFSGVLGILTGLVVLITPFVATIVLTFFLWASIAVWSIFSGAFEIATAIRLRKEIEGEIWMGLSGLLSILLGAVVIFFLTFSPASSLFALGWVLAIYAAVFGVTMILLGLKLRKTDGGSGGSASAKTA